MMDIISDPCPQGVSTQKNCDDESISTVPHETTPVVLNGHPPKKHSLLFFFLFFFFVVSNLNLIDDDSYKYIAVCVCVYINNAAIEKECLELLISMYIGMMMMMMARVDIRSRQERKEEEEKKSERGAFLYCSLLSGCKEAKKYGHGRNGAGWLGAGRRLSVRLYIAQYSIDDQ